MTSRRRARPLLLGALALVAAWGALSVWQRSNRETLVLATTSCPFRGEPQIVIASVVVAADSEPVRAHEEVHAAQCRELGPWRYRWTNLRGAGKLGLEAPAYCAAASVRMRAGQDSANVRIRLIENAFEALGDLADSTTIRRSLQAACPGVAGTS
jgi:hypothetical protein